MKVQALAFPQALVLDISPIPEPPSVNTSYTTFHGKRTLTAAGRKFKTEVLAGLTAELLTCEPWDRYRTAYFIHGGEVSLTLRYFTVIYNASWVSGKLTKTPKGATRDPYKQVDTLNRVKLVEDAIATATGIDDRACCRHVLEKHHHELEPYVSIEYALNLWVPPDFVP